MDPRIDILIGQLEHYRTAVARALDGVPVRLRDAQPTAEGWSVARILEHLARTEHTITRVLDAFVSGAPVRDAADAFDQEQFVRQLDMPAFLDRSRRLKGPQPTGELDASAAWIALSASRTGLMEVLQRARGRRLDESVRDHPVTGNQLNAYQWIAFLGLHEGRHAEQIRETGAVLMAADDSSRGA